MWERPQASIAAGAQMRLVLQDEMSSLHAQMGAEVEILDEQIDEKLAVVKEELTQITWGLAADAHASRAGLASTVN